MIQLLRDAGASVIRKNLQSIRNLDTTIYLQQIGTLQQILQACGCRILATALSAKDSDLAHFLLFDNDIDIASTEADDAEPNPLSTAIASDDIFFTEVLLDRGAKVTDYELTAAANLPETSSSHTKLLRRLLAGFHGNAPNAIGTAIYRSRKGTLKLILEAGVDPTGAPYHFKNLMILINPLLCAPESVLEVAAHKGDRSILKILLQSAPWSPRLRGRALAVALVYHHEFAEDLLESEADVNQEVTIYESIVRAVTPLQIAVKNQHVSIARRLAMYADIDYPGNGAHQRTDFQHAVENGNMELVNMFLDMGVDINGAPAQHGGATALQPAAIRGYLGIARIFIDLGADINANGALFDGRTALEGAAEHGRIDMLHLLHKEGALLSGDGEQQYQRAVGFAERNGHMAAARLLRSLKNA